MKYLLEIGCEEMPSNFASSVCKDFKEIFLNKFSEIFGSKDFEMIRQNTECYVTPRRIVLFSNLPDFTPETKQKVKGPPVRFAYDSNMKPMPALFKFVEKFNISIDNVKIDKSEGGEYVVFYKIDKGLKVSDIIPNILPRVISELKMTKSMRWGAKIRFVRPIRWILSLSDSGYVKVHLGKLESDKFTYLERFTPNEQYEVKSIEDYFNIMKEKNIIIDQNERAKTIELEIKKVLDKDKKIVYDQNLLKEVLFLVESPRAFLGSFNPDFLNLPREVLTTVMARHQRYFAVVDNNNEIMPNFVGIINGVNKDTKIVRAGNEKVLKARLSDAMFFMKKDLTKKLRDRLGDLVSVSYLEGLGNYLDKTFRIRELSLAFNRFFNINLDEELIKNSSTLLKCDLVTQMVFEFPELQGTMGRIYAEKEGIDPEIALAIEEHYLPINMKSPLPTTLLGKLFSFSDKCDHLFMSFLNNLTPSGAGDPYGQRRASAGVLRILMDNGYENELEEIFNFALNSISYITTLPSRDISQLINFMKIRMSSLFIDMGYRYDLVDAVLDITSSPVKAKRRLDVLTEWSKRKDFFDIVSTIIRLGRIISEKEELVAFDPSLLVERDERDLYEKFINNKDNLEDAILNKKYDEILNIIINLSGSIHTFFENVLVNVEDKKLRDNRKALLNLISLPFFRLWNWKKIVRNQ
ncbi:MAG TPA: glycine--tRNA ligase subunit beta [Thermodesulfobium narugense]|nr:MAG: glycine--tRNA ligase subunit beta [Thermodesulfobium narugense]HEM56483.1 glycine--tRNA ligase subunit beta [Thermodesulfobium narugense]